MIMHHLQGSPDPDMQPCDVILPTQFGEDGACALTEMFGTGATISFPEKVNAWLQALDANEAQASDFRELLVSKKLAPTASLWTGTSKEPGFIINLAAFVGDDGYCSLYEFDRTLSFLGTIIAQQAEGSPLLAGDGPTIFLTNLDLFLAKLGHLYTSEEGQLSALYITLMTKKRAAGHKLTRQNGLRNRALPKTIHALEDAIKELACLYVPSNVPSDYATRVGFAQPNSVDRLLSVETCGCAPSFSLTKEDGTLTQALIFRLSHRGYTPHSALTALLNGALSLTPNDKQDYVAMYDLLARRNLVMPARPRSSSNLPLDGVSKDDLSKKSRRFLRLVS